MMKRILLILMLVSMGYTQPTITVQPIPDTVVYEDTASISITATGSDSYQWYRNGSAITNATSNTYTWKTIVADTNATFYCRATNAAGYTQSNTITNKVWWFAQDSLSLMLEQNGVELGTSSETDTVYARA